MNRTEHGNIAVGAPGSPARAESNEAFLTEKLRLMTFAADELRGHFVPNDEEHPAIIAYNLAKNFSGGGVLTRSATVIPSGMNMSWEYYQLIDGKLCDADGSDCFPGTTFETASKAEEYLVENDLRGSVR